MAVFQSNYLVNVRSGYFGFGLSFWQRQKLNPNNSFFAIPYWRSWSVISSNQEVKG
jgi:hypothetical protein